MNVRTVQNVTCAVSFDGLSMPAHLRRVTGDGGNHPNIRSHANIKVFENVVYSSPQLKSRCHANQSMLGP